MSEAERLRLIQSADADFLETLSEFNSPDEVIQSACEHFISLGLKRFSYHFTPPFHSQTSESTVVFAHGFPDEWMERYEDEELRKSDPIPDTVMAAHRELEWRDALEKVSDRTAAKRWWRELVAYNLTEGMGLPLYGPGGRNAYASWSLIRPFIAEDRQLIRTVREIAQAAHMRISHLVLQEMNEGTALSMRESEVLSWIIAGKSRNDIATILDLSSASIDTYLRRIFEKLKVNDRVRASLIALSRELVKLG